MTDEPKLIVKAGRLFYVSDGSYSDYGIYGHFVALQDITSETLTRVVEAGKDRIRSGEARHCGEVLGPESDYYDLKWWLEQAFISDMIRLGIVLEVDAVEVHKDSVNFYMGANELPPPPDEVKE